MEKIPKEYAPTTGATTPVTVNPYFLKNEIKLINQGTFGCIYRPYAQCSDKPIKNKNKYISKIQKPETYSKQEEDIGKIIQTIPGYNDYYAPIIETCQVNIGILKDEEIEKCKVFTPKDHAPPEYISNKIRYIGKKTLGKQLIKIGVKHPKRIVEKLIETQLHILKGIQKLVDLDTPIIHYDLKENNIMYDEKKGKPIIIDFGLSFKVKEINPENYQNFFYVYYNNYPPWCIDILLISYIVQEVFKTKTYQDIIQDQDITNLKNISEDYIKKNGVFKEGFTEEELNKMNTDMKDYIEEYQEKSWKMLIDDLISGYQSWDNYSIAVIYFFILTDIFKHGDIKIESPWIEKYMKILKDVILVSPKDKDEKRRKIPKDTSQDIRELSKSVLKNDINKLKYDITKMYKEKAEQKIRRIYYRSMKQLEEDEHIAIQGHKIRFPVN